MYSKKSSSQYLFSGTETKAINREIMINNVMIATVSFWMVVVANNWFELADARMMMQQVSGLHLIGYCVAFGLLFLLLVGVISIRPNDRLRRFLVKGIWDKLLY